jgi:hypothetical protein
MKRGEIAKWIDRRVQVHFGDDVFFDGVVTRVLLQDFFMKDEKGPVGWVPDGVYKIEDAKWIRAWPPKDSEEECYLYNVALILKEVDDVYWHETRYSVTFSNDHGSVTLFAKPGSLNHADDSEGPELMYSDSDESEAPREDRHLSAMTSPPKAAEQIRRLLMMPRSP